MKKIILIIGLLIGFGLYNQLYGQTYEELYRRAVNAIEQDSLTQAEELLKEALKSEPGNRHNFLIYANLGTILRRMDRKDEALEAYNIALSHAPKSVPTLLNRASLYMEIKREDKAFVDYGTVIDLAPQNEEALFFHAYIAMNKRDYKTVRKDYESLLTINPNHQNGHLGLALLCQKEKRFEEANQILTRLINDEPEKATFYMARANLEIETGQMELALLDAEQGTAIEPENGEYLMTLAEIYLLMNKKRAAQKAIKRATDAGISPIRVKQLLQKGFQ